MKALGVRLVVSLVFVVAVFDSVSINSASKAQGVAVQAGVDAEADRVRATERERIRSLVEANLEVADRLHADDFQLINPVGGSLSKGQYLGGIASGQLHYLVWEPETIAVRVCGQVAIIRYQSRLQVVVQGQKNPLGHYWHTDLYEKRAGQWQVVWSQATEIK